jgi:hypothetical protein
LYAFYIKGMQFYVQNRIVLLKIMQVSLGLNWAFIWTSELPKILKKVPNPRIIYKMCMASVGKVEKYCYFLVTALMSDFSFDTYDRLNTAE